MAFISNSPDLYQSGVDGPMPTEWYGVDAPDGDASDFAQCGPGSRYIQVDIDNEKAIQLFKGKNDARDDDWSGVVIVLQRFSISDFTDGGSTVGTLVLDQGVPVGAFAVRCFLQNVTGFTGNVSATMQVGDGVDADRYTTGTPSVFTTATAIDLGACSGTAIHTAAVGITVTITSNSDFTLVVAGAATLKLVYYV
jgi:hypothetical protein